MPYSNSHVLLLLLRASKKIKPRNITWLYIFLQKRLMKHDYEVALREGKKLYIHYRLYFEKLTIVEWKEAALITISSVRIAISRNLEKTIELGWESLTVLHLSRASKHICLKVKKQAKKVFIIMYTIEMK